MMHCNGGQNTKQHQCGSLMILKKTRFFAPSEIFEVLRVLFNRKGVTCFATLFTHRLMSLAGVARWHTLPRNRCKQPHIGGRPQVENPTNPVQMPHLLLRYKHQQFHECLHLALTTPIVYYPCYLQMTRQNRGE